MNHSGTFPAAAGNSNHRVHPWVQSQRTQRPEEQYVPSRIPSYVSHINLPSTSYTQTRTITYSHQSKVCGQQTDDGVIDGSCQMTIPLELLDQQTTLAVPPSVSLKEIVFLGPPPSSAQFLYDITTRAIHALENVQSLEKITFSLDFKDLARILQTLAAIPNMEEIVLTLPTASKLEPYSVEMLHIQNSFLAGLGHFRHLNRLTIPTEFVTSLLLSHLANLPNLESLTVNYSPPPRSPASDYQNPFPAWSSYRASTRCPGDIFIAHLNFDPRGHFRKLLRLDLGGPLSDTSYTTLRTLFPYTHIC